MGNNQNYPMRKRHHVHTTRQSSLCQTETFPRFPNSLIKLGGYTCLCQ